MPHERERSGRTYFSEFTAPSAFLSVDRIQRAKSNEHLPRFCKSKQTKSSLFSPDYFQLQPTKAKSTQDLRKDDRKSAKFAASQIYITVEEPDASLRLEFERELEEELQKLLKRSCYNTVTVPSSVKFSVTGDLPNKLPQLAFTSPSHSSCRNSVMSRPRSPKSKDPQQLEGLEKLLHNIRQQLNQLSDERTQMEQRMDDVVNGIQEAQTQYHNQLRNYYQGRKRGQKHSPPTPNSLRRVHSSGEKYTHSAWLIPQPSDTSLDVPDGPPSDGKEPVTIFSESSQCSLDDYNMKESNVDSAYGGSCSTRGRRSDSFSSIETRSRSSSLNIGGSLSQSNEVFGHWMSNSTIPELPESPRPSHPCNSSSLSQDSFMQSMPSLSYHSYTTPNRHGRPASPLSMSVHTQRSYSTSTPKNNAVKPPSSPKMMRLKPPLKATSSPDVSRKGIPAKSDRHQLKTHRSYHHNSLPDSVMNSVIAEDSQSLTDSLSQISTCTEDGSPKPTGSTIIVRRSSLTGQLEHIRKPRVATVKRNSSFDVSKDYSTQLGATRSRAASVYAGMTNQTLPKEFKVLNRGIRRRKTSRPIILNTSVETTV